MACAVGVEKILVGLAMGCVTRWFGCGAICAAVLAMNTVAAAADAPPSVVENPSAPAKVPVLLQLLLTVDGRPRDPVNSLKLYSARLDSPDPPRLLSPTIVAGARGDGAVWVRLAFEPGSHFLLVLPPGLSQNPPAVAYHAPSARYGRLVRYGTESLRGAIWQASIGGFVYTGSAPDHFRPLEGFLLQVPRAAGAVYGGTLTILCTDGAGLLRDLIRVCSDISVSDRHAEAPAVAGDTEAVSNPVTPYGMPLAVLDLRGEGLIIEGVHKASAVTAADRGAMPLAVPPRVMAPGPAANLFNLLMLGGKLSADAANSRFAGAQAEAWRPCLHELANESAAEGFEALILEGAGRARQAAWEADRDRGSVPTRPGMIDFNLAIELTPQQLQMASCRDAEHFCLEMAMRVTVRDLAAGRPIFDAVTVYADDLNADDPLRAARRQLQLRTEERPAAKTRHAWCGKDRLEQFRTEIGKASEAIVRNALRRMQGPW